MKWLALAFVSATVAVVLSSAPPASGQTIKQIKQGSGGPTAGSDGTATLNNLTFTVPGAVVAKYATYGGLRDRIVNPILNKFDKVADLFGKKVSSAGIKNGSVKPIDLSPEVQATIAAATAPVGSAGIQDNSVGANDLSPAVRESIAKAAVPGPVGDTGEAGARGPEGPQGAPGGALAYARVFAAGTVDSAISKDIEMLSASGGIYCLRYTAGVPHIVSATVDVSGADGGRTLISATADKEKIDAAGACPTATNIEVVTANAQTTAQLSANFYLVVNF